MRHMNQTLRLVAAVWMVLGLTAVEATGQTPAGAETWASVAAGLEEERGNEELQRVPPFKVFDNLYYIGVGYTGSWLITTDDGLIVLDAVDQRYADHLIASIRELGFDPDDVRYVIIGQAHADHLGATTTLQDDHGATVGMGEQDWVFMEETAAAGRLRADAPRRDLEIRDGDTLTSYDQPTWSSSKSASHSGNGPLGLNRAVVISRSRFGDIRRRLHLSRLP